MAGLGATRRGEFGRVQAAQYFASHLLGLNAADRHKRLVADYQRFYQRDDGVPGGAAGPGAAAPPRSVRTDADALRDHHRFIRDDADDAAAEASASASAAGWEARLAKRYYDRLFKEYAICDLSLYKQSKVGMRWRTQKEVLSGKGQFVCGAKGCEAAEGLCSYEVNFAYVEAGERKQALVKLRVCPSCAYKLNYKKEKQLQKATDAVAARKRKRQEEEDAAGAKDPLVREALEYVQRYARGEGVEGEVGEAEEDALARAARDVAPPPPPLTAAAAAGGGAAAGVGAAGGLTQPAVILLPADNSVWETKPAQESATVEDEMDSFLESMFV